VSERPILQRTFRAELQPREGRIIEGCCVPYDQPARVSDAGGPPYMEVFEPGAFRKQLRAADRVGLRFEHRDEIFHRIGRCQELEERAEGLYGSFTIHPGPFGDQAIELVRAGELTGFSVGFSDRFEHWRRLEDGTVVRSACQLHEVSLCEEPAYAGALITAQRSRDQLAAELELPPRIDDELAERLRAVGVKL
jgi:HK97 family phage prohead protease